MERPDGTTPKMNSDCRQLIRNWITIATFNGRVAEAVVLQRLLDETATLDGTTELNQEAIDQLVMAGRNK